MTMTVDKWLSLFEEAFKYVNKQFTAEDKSFLCKQYFKDLPDYEKAHALEIIEIFTRYFLFKATRGETFGPISKVELSFGRTLEENYGLIEGPFLNLARSYWTYRFEVDDYFMSKKGFEYILDGILRQVEINIAGLFFPTPGGVTIPVEKRMEDQRQFLKEFAPTIDVENFLLENPILKLESSRQGSFLKPRLVPITVGFVKLFLAIVIYIIFDNIFAKILSFLLGLWSIVSFKVGFKASDKELEDLVNNPDIAPESSNAIFRKYVFDEDEYKHKKTDN